MILLGFFMSLYF